MKPLIAALITAVAAIGQPAPDFTAQNLNGESVSLADFKGKAYGAKVTPQLFIINKDGILAYDGAIDSKATSDAKDIETADPLFANALDAVLTGKEVSQAKNKPYGCGVKY